MNSKGRYFVSLVILGLATGISARAENCVSFTPADDSSKISFSQDEKGITIRATGGVKVSGDASAYSVSAGQGTLVWFAPISMDSAVSTSRAGGVIKTCVSAPMGLGTQPISATVPPAGNTFAAAPTSAAMPTPTAPGVLAVANTPATATTPVATTPPAAATTPAEATPPVAPAKPATATEPAATSQDAERIMVTTVEKALKENRIEDAQDSFSGNTGLYVNYLKSLSKTRDPLIPQQLLSEAEEKRIDQQVGTTQPSTGTSVASKGSVPWLLGFAAESGALTQSSSNNVLTFSGTPANVVKALKAHNYLASYTVGTDNPFVKWFFNRLSFSVSFNVAQASNSSSFSGGGGSAMTVAASDTTTASQNGTLAGYTLRYSILNHRDARDPRYQARWSTFVEKNAPAMLNAETAFVQALLNQRAEAYRQWQTDSRNAITSVNLTDAQISEAFRKRAEALGQIVGNDATLQDLVDKAAVSIATYAQERRSILDQISKSATVAFEYTNTHQTNLLGNPVTVTNPTGMANPVPNLSTFNFVVDKGMIGASQVTANASATIYDSIPSGIRIGRVRDYRFALETDIPLPEIPNVGMPILTFSSLFLSLLNQPLGEMVVVNGVPVSLTGNVGLFQAKISIKVKNTGVKIPVALTYSNRTELIKESDVRGSIGVTYNLDSLFAKQ